MVLVFLSLVSSFLYAQTEVYKYEFDKKIKIKFVRAQVDEFESYLLTSANGREMFLVCAGNILYDKNKDAFLEYRNFYNQKVARFKISDNRICLDLGKFIQDVDMGINDGKPFIFHLDTKKKLVEKIYYPKINPYIDIGQLEDLLPKRPVRVKYLEKKLPKKKSKKKRIEKMIELQ